MYLSKLEVKSPFLPEPSDATEPGLVEYTIYDPAGADTSVRPLSPERSKLLNGLLRQASSMKIFNGFFIITKFMKDIT